MLENKIDALIVALEANTAALSNIATVAKTRAVDTPKEDKKTKPKDADVKVKPADEKQETVKAVISDDDLRAVFADYIGKEDSDGYTARRDSAKAVIAENGGKKIVDIPADRRAIAVSQVKKLKETGKVNLMEDEEDL